MTDNWAGIVSNTLAVAFFVVAIIGIGLGVYVARVLKKREGEKVSTQ